MIRRASTTFDNSLKAGMRERNQHLDVPLIDLMTTCLINSFMYLYHDRRFFSEKSEPTICQTFSMLLRSKLLSKQSTFLKANFFR